MVLNPKPRIESNTILYIIFVLTTIFVCDKKKNLFLFLLGLNVIIIVYLKT